MEHIKGANLMNREITWRGKKVEGSCVVWKGSPGFMTKKGYIVNLGIYPCKGDLLIEEDFFVVRKSKLTGIEGEFFLTGYGQYENYNFGYNSVSERADPDSEYASIPLMPIFHVAKYMMDRGIEGDPCVFLWENMGEADVADLISKIEDLMFPATPDK